VSSAVDFNRTDNIKARHAGEQSQEPDLDASLLLLLCALSPLHAPQLVLLLVIGGFLMSPFKTCLVFLLFLPVLQEVNICRNSKKKK